MAERFLDAVTHKLEQLRRAPGIGVSRDIFAAGLRVTFHGAYALYYMTTATELVIVRVLHGARNVDAIAESGGFDVH